MKMEDKINKEELEGSTESERPSLTPTMLPCDTSFGYSILDPNKTTAIEPEMYRLTFDVQPPSLMAGEVEDAEFDDKEIRGWIDAEREKRTPPDGQIATLDVSGELCERIIKH